MKNRHKWSWKTTFSVLYVPVVLVVQWFGVGLVIERLLVRLAARALSS